MVIALLTAAAFTVAVFAVVVWLATVQWRLAVIVVLFAISGVAADRARRRRLRGPIAPGSQRRAERVLARLAVVADQRVPRVAIEPGEAPLAWTTALPFRAPTI